jgi:hypothetical protein
MVAGRTGLLFFIAAFYLACGAEADQDGGEDGPVKVRELSKYLAIHKENILGGLDRICFMERIHCLSFIKCKIQRFKISHKI